MTILNLAAGWPRPGPPFLNVDVIRSVLKKGTRSQDRIALAELNAEPNYLEYDLSCLPWPWETGSVDGILCSHFLEHWTAQESLVYLTECRRVLKPDGGCLRVSVPDATYFRTVHSEDIRPNWQTLFGELNDKSDAETYMEVALFYEEHKQLYTEDVLWCQLVQAGFLAGLVNRVAYQETVRQREASCLLAGQDNREKFSLFMEAWKE